MSRLCPDCRQPLRSTGFLNVSLDTCPLCGGIWFDEGELVKLHSAGKTVSLRSLEDRVEPKIAAVTDRGQDRLCPGCNLRLTPYRYLYDSDVYLDECDECLGIWMEDGELDKIAAVLDARAIDIDDDQVAKIEALSTEFGNALHRRSNRAKGAVAFWSLAAQRRLGS